MPETRPVSDLMATAEALRATFPGREDAPAALTLLWLLAQRVPVSVDALGEAAGRPLGEVATQLALWPNVERDEDGRVVGFSGLTLRSTAHRFEVGGRELHTWCAWDTLFLPAMLGASARVRSRCPVTGNAVELVVSRQRVEHAQPEPLYVSFPPPASTDTDNITGSFCCHVHFLAGDDAAGHWREPHPDGEVLDVQAAFALGCRTVAPLTAASAAKECC